MSARILILTAGFGEGHNAAARALADGFARAGNPACVVDAFALASPRFNAVARNFYLRLINDAPRLWSAVYGWIDRSHLVENRLWFFRREIEILAGLIARDPPDAICCTYPLYAFFLERIARDRDSVPPVFNVVTDSISIHSLWWRAAANGWFLPNEDSAAVVRRAGIDPDFIHVFGFPVPEFFAGHAGKPSPPALVAGAAPRVLHIINSGTRHAAETARRLLAETDWEITCAVGRDEILRTQLRRFAAERSLPTQILGWTDQIPRLLMTHHAVVSKAGGATTQEAIAALCPMIVSQVVPGQEEGNYELLRRHGAGTRADTPEDVIGALRGAFAHNGRLWHQWRTALRPLARPRAADDIAAHVLATCSALAGAAAASGRHSIKHALPIVAHHSPLRSEHT